VALVTIAFDNGQLVQALTDHVNAKRQIENEVGGVKLAAHLGWVGRLMKVMPTYMRYGLQLYGFGRDLDFWHLQASLLEGEIVYHQTQPFFAQNVYVTFESESCQLNCLKCTSIGTIPRLLGISSERKKNFAFRKGRCLEIEEADEPSSIVWENIGMAGAYGKLRTYSSLGVFFCALGASTLTITTFSKYLDERIVLACISVMNITFPVVIRIATEALEIHENQETMQVSIFMKVGRELRPPAYAPTLT
jgi:hypothetical protein